jgi:hypothetical protein
MMKIQLQLDLGEIRWAARNYLEGSLPCRYCQDEGEAAKTRCECPQGSLFFSILPSPYGQEDDFRDEPHYRDPPVRTSN